MLPQEIIRRKRDGLALSDEEIGAFVAGIAADQIGEGQMAAFAMAVVANGLDRRERTALTRAMAGSGTIIDWRDMSLDGPVLDKHSTGGVGDKVSLILAPIIAACGGYVPMLSGRGLGHTGGTLDKLSAIPGYETQPDVATLRRVVKSTGSAIVGATAALAPADRRLYAVRDVTATVESLDLITASILAKKLAAGLDALVMDVKVGSGAFLPDRTQAKSLASSIVGVAADCGLPTVALLTDMNAVLGRTAGNALEVAEAIDVLKTGTGDSRLIDVTIALAGELLALGRLADSPDEGEARARTALASGQAAEHFARMVTALGGPAELLDRPQIYLAAAPCTVPAVPDEAATIVSIDVRQVGLAIVALGGGRVRTSDAVDVSVGLSEIAGIGDIVAPQGRPLALIHARDATSAEAARATLLAAFRLVPPGASPIAPPLIPARISA